MSNYTKCLKCGGTAEVTAQEASHDESLIEVSISCVDLGCKHSAFAFIDKEDFAGVED